MACPACRSWQIRRSRRRNLVEKGMALFVRPYRCMDCGFRFFQYRFQTPARLRQRLVQVAASCRRTLRKKTGETPPRLHFRAPNPIAHACNVLGLNGIASDTEISAAYHRLARLYHPDKVSGLAAELQALADERMKEINAAYEILKPRALSSHLIDHSDNR